MSSKKWGLSHKEDKNTFFTPLESLTIPACRQTGMPGILSIGSISLSLRAGLKSHYF